MIDDAKTLLDKAINSSLSRNVISLYVLQFANNILPLIVVPYLLRVLGAEKFGAVAFGQSLMNYFVLVVNYSFDWYATREVSVQRDDLGKVIQIATGVWSAKTLLCVLGFLMLALLVLTVPRLGEVSTLLFVLYGIVIGNVLFPRWLFQGLEHLVVISIINLVSRLLFTLGAFVLIRHPSDFVLYAGLLSLKWLTAGLIGVWWAHKRLGILFSLSSWNGVWQSLAEGWMLFVSKGAINIYTAGNAFLLGLLTNNLVVGYYSAGEKLVKVVQGLITPISQAFYPRLSRIAAESRDRALFWGGRVLILVSGVGLILSIGLFIGAPLIVRITLGPGYGPSVSVMRILAFLPFIIGISNVLGIQIMLPFGYDRPFTTIVILSAIINLVTALFLVPIWQEDGMAMTVLITEIIITLTIFAYVSAKQINPVGKLFT